MSRRRSRGATPAFGLSLLDLLSCAFGGVIVLAMVFALLSGSRRQAEERSFLNLDLTFRVAGMADLPTAEQEALRRLLNRLQLSVKVEGIGDATWTARWIGGEERLPITDPGIRSQVLAGPLQSGDGGYVNVSLRGLPTGSYEVTIFPAAIDLSGLDGDGVLGHEPNRRSLLGKRLELELEEHYPGAKGEPRSLIIPSYQTHFFKETFDVHL